MLEKTFTSQNRNAIVELQRRRTEVLVGAAIGAVLASMKGVTPNDTLESALLYSGGVPSDITDTISIVSLKATGTITLAGVVAGDKVVIGGKDFTAITFDVNPSNTSLAPYKFPVGATDAITAANLAHAVQASSDTVDATSLAAVVTLVARADGTAGNALALVVTGSGGHAARSAATLQGGFATGGFKSTVDTSTKQVVVTWFDKI